MANKVYSIAHIRFEPCQDALTSIPLYNISAEVFPPVGERTGSDLCARDIRINRERPFSLLNARVIVKVDGLGQQVVIIVHSIGR